MLGRMRVAGLVVAVAALHAFAWGLYVAYARGDAKLAGLGLLAYALGLRHAFDVDHLAAIDNATRNLVARGRSSAGVGFFFSLGHSSVVLGLVTAIIAFGLPATSLGRMGGGVGTGVSAAFLLLIGLLNLGVLLDRGDKSAGGPLTRLGVGRLFRLVGRSWHAFPIGALFALGFDTASEIALLALAAGAAGGLPLLGALVLPLLFTSGMVLLDTADGILMAAAYGWATTNPDRRVRTNTALTGLSVAIAFTAGVYEVARVGSPLLLYGMLALLTAGAAVVVLRARPVPESG
jgi:high-affinity nickel-transport protein